MLSGVIQGSGSGPVAFVIFIDTLAKLLEAHNIKSKMFADDVKVIPQYNKGYTVIYILW